MALHVMNFVDVVGGSGAYDMFNISPCFNLWNPLPDRSQEVPPTGMSQGQTPDDSSYDTVHR